MTDHGWDGDVNEAVVGEWTEETTPFERVEEVVLSTTEYQYAGEIAGRARVSEPSARKHLHTLAGTGIATTEETDRGTRFKRSAETVALQRIREIHASMTREELVEGIRDTKRRIADYEDRHDATDPDELALSLDADDDGWADIADWRGLEEDLKLAQAALSLYDFDPDDERRQSAEDGGGSGGGEPTRGAFGGDDGDGLSV